MRLGRTRTPHRMPSDPETYLAPPFDHTHSQRTTPIEVTNTGGLIVFAVLFIILVLHLIHRQDHIDHQEELNREAICAILNAIPPAQRTPQIEVARDVRHFDCVHPGPGHTKAKPTATPALRPRHTRQAVSGNTTSPVVRPSGAAQIAPVRSSSTHAPPTVRVKKTVVFRTKTAQPSTPTCLASVSRLCVPIPSP